jgi:predicted AAA+ superfamily ATPase
MYLPNLVDASTKPDIGCNTLEIKRFFFDKLAARLQSDELNFMQVLIGPRQVGKSTAIGQFVGTWAGSKVIESADQITPPKTDWIEFHWNRALQQPGISLLVLDEIQKVRDWSNVVKILFDRDRKKNKLRIVLSGSASLSLQSGLKESLAGRYELIKCPHWGLDESYEAFHWDLLSFLKFGGYPSAAPLTGDVDRWRAFMRDSIIEPVIGRDLQSAVSIQKPALLRQLFELAMGYPAQEISLQKLLGQLQDEGNTAIIKHYLDILAGGFLVATLEKYSGSILRQKSSSPKILPLAPALIHAFTDPEKITNDPDWRGRVFEVAIGAHLYRLPGDLMYWRDGKDEVDFVLKMDGAVTGIEVKSGRRARQNGLMAFKKKFPNARVMTLDWSAGERFLSRPPDFKNLPG